MRDIETHIQHDKEILDNPQTSPQARRHTEEELAALEAYAENHKEEMLQEIIMILPHLNCIVMQIQVHQSV